MTGRAPAPRGFGSDNHAGVHPDVLAAIAAANTGHAGSYGHDEWTARAEARLQEHFGADALGFLVFNGTGANVVALRAMCRPWEGVICPATAHLEVDECGAPEVMGGVKLLTVETSDGKLRPADVAARVQRVGDEHAVQARVVSISNSTELGTVYDAGEVSALADAAHDRGLLLHVDGARLANAAAALGVELAAITTECGVDAVSFGGTKNGLLAGEAVVMLRPELAEHLLYLRKQSMQLASKMRFVAAQFDALLAGELWRELAAHSNAMARRLADALREAPGVEITQEPQANAVFAVIDRAAAERLREHWRFYDWDEARGEVRWMCSWDTTADDVDAFAADVRAACR
jgi:threonine aldolase